jgi:2-keto-3-deoxy-L-rhamnonate aldolase RhmA
MTLMHFVCEQDLFMLLLLSLPLLLTTMLSLRQSLLNGGKAYGSLIMSNSPIVAEMMGEIGYDFLIIDHEHTPTGIESGQALLQSLGRSRSEPIVRLPAAHDHVYMKKVLDSMRLPGGVLVPMVDTPEQAQQVVESTRYPPAGKRGCAVPFVRASGWGMQNTPEYIQQCNDNLLVMVQVETPLGVSNIPEIAAVDGVDMIFLGPVDLSASIGKMFQFDDPQVQELIQEAEDKVREAPTCMLGGFRPPGRSVQEMLDVEGYSLVAGSVDMGLLREAAKQDWQGGKHQ